MPSRSRPRTVSRIAAAALAVVATTASCDPTGALAPADPQTVSITLGVTGGVGGADYAFTIDGGQGEVRGVRCLALCDFAAGQLLLVVSPEQVAYLAGLLDRAGAIGLDGRDFGEECCDQRLIELHYERGERMARISGTEGRFPDSLAYAVSAIAPLVRGVSPVIVAPQSTEADWPRDPYDLGAVRVDGLILRAAVSYSGGCEAHPMDLVLWGGWMESYPVQINALITHDGADDPCDAIVTEERSFDLGGLAKAYAESYGESGGEPIRVILRLWDPDPELATRAVEVEL